MKRRKKKTRTPTPMIPTDKFHHYIMLCLVCGKETGEKMHQRASLADPVEMFGPDPNNWKLRRGLCPSCTAEMKKGHTLFFSDTRGCIVGLEGNEELKPGVRGGCWKVPESEMDKLLGTPPQPEQKIPIED